MPAATAWLAQAEGLGQVVVGAHLEAEDAIELTRLRRQHQDQQLGADGPEPAADLEAVHTGEHQVDHHEFGVGVHGRREPIDAVVDDPTTCPSSRNAACTSFAMSRSSSITTMRRRSMAQSPTTTLTGASRSRAP